MENSEYLEITGEFSSEKDRLRYIRAKNRVKELRGFYIHLSLFIAINLILIGFNVLYHELGYLKIKVNQFYTLILWGIVILIHAGRVFLPNFILGKNWEENEIKRQMEKDQFKN